MLPQIENLKKFIGLEIKRNFDNRAVMGGFQKLLPVWQSDESVRSVDAVFQQAVIAYLMNYANWPLARRKEETAALLARLNADSAPAPKAEPRAARVRETIPPEQQYAVPPKARPAKQPKPKTTAAQNTAKSRKTHLDLKIQSPLTSIHFIGKTRENALHAAGVHTIEDLLYYFPRKYEDYRKLSTIDQLVFGEQVTILGVVKAISARSSKNRNIQITEVVIEDGTGVLRISFFNQPYLERQLKKGDFLAVKGKVEMYLGRLVMNSPIWEKIDQDAVNINGINPVYKLPDGFSQKAMHKIIHETLSVWESEIKDYLPQSKIDPAGMPDLKTAIHTLHKPLDFEELERARNRISFDQIFFLQMGVLGQKRMWKSRSADSVEVSDSFLEKITGAIPFKLTKAQLASIEDIRKDIASGIPMNRLIQGDVGSGKTLVAFVAIAMILSKPGTQAAFMAPTGILADQHFKKAIDFFAGNKLIGADQICLLVGDTPAKEKEIIRQRLSAGEIRLLIGTHALIEDPIFFRDLRLVVIDEQHRFGVEQRKKLREKGPSAHLMVMTATPIPRSLALTVYGDLDLSKVDEMPVGRKAIITDIVKPRDRHRVYQFIRDIIDQGQQVYIIYPLVKSDDEDEQEASNAAVNEYKRLKKDVFPQTRVALLHGKMSPVEKEKTMRDFYSGHYRMLVSTTVIEVGVDVPNASVMVIEGANRFGLAQLHQLRGRVGRGSQQSYCFLVPETDDALENERLTALKNSTDGFELAEIDLQQRGAGDFLGHRQSGFKDLQLMNIMNVQLIERARSFAEDIFKIDPDLESDENQEMRKFLNYYWNQTSGELN